MNEEQYRELLKKTANEPLKDNEKDNSFLHSVSKSDSTSPTVYTEWNRIIQEIADEECMSIDNRILRHLKTKYHPPIKRSGC